MRSGVYVVSCDGLKLDVRIDAWGNECEIWILNRGYVSVTPFDTLLISNEFTEHLRNVWGFSRTDEGAYTFRTSDSLYLGVRGTELCLSPEPVSWSVTPFPKLRNNEPVAIKAPSNPTRIPFAIRTRRTHLPDVSPETAASLRLTTYQAQVLVAVACASPYDRAPSWGCVAAFARKTGCYEKRRGPRLYLPLSLAFVASCVDDLHELAAVDATSEHEWLEAALSLVPDKCRHTHDIRNFFLAPPLSIIVQT